MNLLKALFSSDLEEADFFETTYPLTNNFFNGDQDEWYAQFEALAVVKDDIQPGQLGRVKFQGVRWRACCDRPLSISIESKVRVLGRRANILVVEPMDVCAVC
ncbi:NfeD family protein [Oscillatoria sp. CS-180]|uniref:NfeD family protein n=1 Tax=Oscillatoria sp. CS-180 TaxID=3021720 RepID=UPI00232C5553|nr:NfeD family protein [Oscillatoria sp. CS-180]MDB9527598.1 NfeD family protein [Oscillatoria sp. CS-180]